MGYEAIKTRLRTRATIQGTDVSDIIENLDEIFLERITEIQRIYQEPEVIEHAILRAERLNAPVNAFNFSATPQGRQYWNTISRQYF